MMRTWFLVLGLALIAGALAGQEAAGAGSTPKGPPGIAWEPDWAQARARAREENRPIMDGYFPHPDERMYAVVADHFHNRDILAASRRFVCLVACLGAHEEKQGTRHDGTEGPICEAFGSVRCGDHVRVEGKARMALMDSPLVSCPQFIFLMPDGETILLRHVWMLAPSDLLKKMQLAYAYFDPESAPGFFRSHQDRIDKLLELADSDHEGRRQDALRTLARSDDPRITAFLVRQTNPNVESNRRIEAIRAMRERGNAKVLDALHTLLKERDGQVRLHTAVALEGIGMVESVTHLEAALKREDKDRVRSHLLRALAGCCRDIAPLEKAVQRALKSSSQVDRVTACYLALGLRDPDVTLVKALMRAAQDPNTRVHCAALLALGSLKAEQARKLIAQQTRGARDPELGFGLWALERLGGEPYTGDVDPYDMVASWLPDNDLYQSN